jgi:hypothetical protein
MPASGRGLLLAAPTAKQINQLNALAGFWEVVRAVFPFA